MDDEGATVAVDENWPAGRHFSAPNQGVHPRRFTAPLQHRVAGTVPATVHSALSVLRHLARRPLWLVATSISFVALMLHAIALKTGSIALVQPLMLVGVVLAVPLRAALEREIPTWPELRAVIVTMLGLGTFLGCANPTASDAAPSLSMAVPLVLSGIAVALAAQYACATRYAGRPRLQSAVLGAAAGVLFGLTAGLLKLIGSVLTLGSVQATSFALPAAGLVGAGLLGTALNQRAYQIAALAFSMPLVNVVDVLVAVLFGALVFHEPPAHNPMMLPLQLAALGCVAVGLRQVAQLEPDCASPEPVCASGRCAR